MARSEDNNNKIPKKDFGLEIIGNTTSNFVFDRLFKLYYYTTTECTNIKLATINHHPGVSVTRDLMTPS